MKRYGSTNLNSSEDNCQSSRRFCKKLIISLLNIFGEKTAHLIISFLNINCFLNEEECTKNVMTRLDTLLGKKALNIIMNIGWKYRVKKWR